MNDEMKPALRTIQNRIKQVFGYKIETSVWDMLINSVQTLPEKQNFLNLSYGLKKKILICNANYEFHYADIESIYLPGTITSQHFRIVQKIQGESNKLISLLYPINTKDWPTYDKDNFDDTNIQLLNELKQFLLHYFEKQYSNFSLFK